MALSMSKRALRMERRHQKAGPAHLNIVSLMDIFTLLVFFLLASNDTEVLPSASIVKMPESVSEQKPRETVVVMYFLEGGVKLTSQDGSVVEIHAGEAVIIPRDWRGVWDTDGYTKIYVIYSPEHAIE